MANDALLVQHTSENYEGSNLFKVTAPRNIEYCLLHRMDFEMLMTGEVVGTGDWEKVRLIRAAMDLPYKYVIWLDCDTLIIDLTADLREACPPDKIGACRHILTRPPYNVNLDHFNAGAIYVSNCDATRSWVDKWLAGFPGKPGPAWYEQGVFNDINDGTVVEIDAKYNCTGTVNPSPHPVVLGFHGQGDTKKKFNDMLKAIGK